VTGAVIDTSAIVAILLREPTAPALLDLLHACTPRLMSAASRIELGMVAESRIGPRAPDAVARFLRDTRIEIVPVDSETADRALVAWRRFGKGNHPAALNFGDCISYATAEQHALPLLCIGNDFRATDIPVLGPA
jgi:ribonuclease VapC